MKTTAEVDPVNAAPAPAALTRSTERLRLPRPRSSSAARARRKPGAPGPSTRPTTRSRPCSPRSIRRSTARSIAPSGIGSCRSSCSSRQRRRRRPTCQRVMDDSLAVVRRHRDAGHAATTQQRKICRRGARATWPRLGYWGLLVDREYGGSGAPFRGVRAVSHADGDDRPDDRRPGLRPRLHRRGRSGAHVRQRRSRSSGSCRSWPAASGSRPSP